MKPIVSIILPTRNRSDLLIKAITSIKRQTFSDWELFVIDNFSTDDTPSLLEKLCSEDDRIFYFNVPKSKNRGISDYLNFGIKKSRGRYIARLDDDDYWYYEDKLKIQADFLDKHSEYCVVGGGIILINREDEHLFKYYKKENDSEIRKYCLFANPFTHTTVMFRKSVAEEVGFYPVGLIEDWRLWLEMGKKGKFYNFPIHFTCYMSAGQNISFKMQREQTKTILKLIKQHKNDYPNFRKAYFLNYIQYLYSFLPIVIRKRLQSFMFYLKRKNF